MWKKWAIAGKRKRYRSRSIIHAYIGLAILLLGGSFVFWSFSHTVIAKKLNMGSKASDSTRITELTVKGVEAPIKTFNLTAEAAKLDLGHGKTMNAWTFNGIAPGPELRVKQGDKVVVNLTNKLKVGVTIHWHGLNVPGAMDGIAGVTQDAVKPGSTFTYTFIANQPGTFWYHSHQDSSNEVARGLYGVLVVEPKNQMVLYDKDYTVALHEWNTKGSDDESMGNMMDMHMDSSKGDMGDMDMGSMNMNGPVMMPTSKQQSVLTNMQSMYDVFTANNTSEGLHFDAKPGEYVHLRLVNTGNMAHLLTLDGAAFKVTALDGHDLAGGTPITKTLLPIGGAQRYDIAFKMPEKGSVRLIDANPNSVERKMLSATFGSGEVITSVGDPMDFSWFDFSKYGKKRQSDARITLHSNFTKRYNMTLGAGMGFFNGSYQMVYTINGKVFPNIPDIKVEKGDIVKIHFKNNSHFIHPMHLHGHSFQVLTRNGKPLNGSPVELDTLNVLPGETYDIAFKANNPGLWMFHCHDLHHAAAGMDTMVNYDGISTPYTIGEGSGNNPE